MELQCWFIHSNVIMIDRWGLPRWQPCKRLLCSWCTRLDPAAQPINVNNCLSVSVSDCITHCGPLLSLYQPSPFPPGLCFPAVGIDKHTGYLGWNERMWVSRSKACFWRAPAWVKGSIHQVLQLCQLGAKLMLVPVSKPDKGGNSAM